MTARGHVTVDDFTLDDVDDVLEQVGFAVLAAEVLSTDAERTTWALGDDGRSLTRLTMSS